VEEIDDIDGCSTDPFVAAAIANERELDLSDEQRKQFKKVCRYCIISYSLRSLL
jgi:transcriptional regulator ATRX